MTMNEIREQIRTLEEKESYFGLISNVSQMQGVTLKIAWSIVEARREQFGLNPKFKSYASFYNARYLHHARGEMIRINPPDESEEVNNF